MKANTIVLSEQDATCLNVNAKNNFLFKKKLSPYIFTEEVVDQKKGIIVLPIDQLTEAQLRQVQAFPGAFYLESDEQFSSTSPYLLQHTPLESNPVSEKLRFMVKHSTRLLSIEVDQIAYFYAENRLNFIKTWNNKTYIIDKTIEEITKLLNKNDFFRINRSYIIAYKSIEEVYTHFNNRLKLKLNINVPEELFVSKDRVASFKEWLGA